jgi:hypothetical protein
MKIPTGLRTKLENSLILSMLPSTKKTCSKETARESRKGKQQKNAESERRSGRQRRKAAKESSKEKQQGKAASDKPY